MKVFVLEAEHQSVPGRRLTVHLTKRSADVTAAELVAIIAKDWLADNKDFIDDFEMAHGDIEDSEDPEEDGDPEIFTLPTVTPENYEDILHEMCMWEVAHEQDTGRDEETHPFPYVNIEEVEAEDRT